eukprot:TRINITY_DN2096_c0_g1_i1.p1 TRINITY_DN2096_c0_g1~~TRINITY_DN2096_c0_g1_i1.p1  ORF type:complete len:184 (+),score=68.10 TRINITY_DN2096_c0_g1_i1:341-892(+)
MHAMLITAHLEQEEPPQVFPELGRKAAEPSKLDLRDQYLVERSLALKARLRASPFFLDAPPAGATAAGTDHVERYSDAYAAQVRAATQQTLEQLLCFHADMFPADLVAAKRRQRLQQLLQQKQRAKGGKGGGIGAAEALAKLEQEEGKAAAAAKAARRKDGKAGEEKQGAHVFCGAGLLWLPN